MSSFSVPSGSDPSVALVEKVRAREDELKKREREVKQREAQLKERGDELESAKGQVDSMMADLERREQTIAELEKKHGSLAKREEAAHQRDMLLSDREVQLQDRLADFNRKEKEAATLHRNRQKDYEQRTGLLVSHEADLKLREEALCKREDEVKQKLIQLKDESARLEAEYSDRERELRSGAIQQSEAWRDVHRRQAELEQMYLEYQDKAKLQRAEHIDMETRDRDLKWKEEQARQLHAELTEKKRQLLAWESKLTDLNCEAEELQAQLLFQKEKAEQTESRLAAKASQLLDAEKELRQREVQLDKEDEELKERAAAVAAQERSVRIREAEALRQHAEAQEALNSANAIHAGVLQRQKWVDGQLHIMREKERALKDWLVELEFRRSTLRKKELHPPPYLQQLDATEDEDSHIAPQFNTAILQMQLQRIQGAYLGATLKSRAKRAGLQEAQRKTTPIDSNAHDDTSSLVERTTMLVELEAELRRSEDEFKELVTGYFLLEPAERSRLFLPDEEVLILETIEQDVYSYDEEVFLSELTAAPPIEVEVNSSPQDTKLLGVVTRWLNERTELVAERRRRVHTHKLNLLEKALGVLRGRIVGANQRRKVLTEMFSDGSLGLSEEFKQRARTRLPAIMPSDPKGVKPKSKRDGSQLQQRRSQEWAGGSPSASRSRASTPLIGYRSPSTSGAGGATPPRPATRQGQLPSLSPSLVHLEQSIPHLASTEGSYDETQSNMSPSQSQSVYHSSQVHGSSSNNQSGTTAERALVEALPAYLRHHYGAAPSPTVPRRGTFLSPKKGTSG